MIQGIKTTKKRNIVGWEQIGDIHGNYFPIWFKEIDAIYISMSEHTNGELHKVGKTTVWYIDIPQYNIVRRFLTRKEAIRFIESGKWKEELNTSHRYTSKQRRIS